MTYAEALSYIHSLQARGWRLGLDRMDEFLRVAGLSDSLGGETGPQFIHVAGTNGKGSTTAFLQSILVESGYRTGAFFSPYVVDPRERVQFGRDLIAREDLVAITERLRELAEPFSEGSLGAITEFEFKTALGFAYWKERQCEWVALEVGLGGRLDATNLVKPRASVIVSIGLDHVQILGNTIAEIAFEKAGIVKPGIPLILGEVPPDAEAVIRRVAAENEAPVWHWGSEVRWDDEIHGVVTPMRSHPDLVPSLVGSVQRHNLALAVAAIDVSGAFRSEDGVQRGASHASIPGRFQRIRIQERDVLFDGAHNADSARVLVEALKAELAGRKVSLVTNMLSGHEPAEFYDQFQGFVSRIHVAPVDFIRATPVQAMVEYLKTRFNDVSGYETAEAALLGAIAESSPSDVVVVTGTFYLVGELLRRFNGT